MCAQLVFSLSPFSNITLESEINVYRRLLDSETNRLSQQPVEHVLPVEPAPPSFGSELGKVFNKKIKKGPIAISTYSSALFVHCSQPFSLSRCRGLHTRWQMYHSGEYLRRQRCQCLQLGTETTCRGIARYLVHNSVRYRYEARQ